MMNRMNKILFICHGNICRSPMAEFVLKAMVKEHGIDRDFYIESAAVSNEEIGNGIYPPARRCLSQHGIWFDTQRTARRVTRADYENFDHLICMDSSNLRWLRHIIGDDSEGKVSLMMSFTGRSRDVADPWYTGDFEATYRDVVAGCTKLLEHLGYEI